MAPVLVWQRWQSDSMLVDPTMERTGIVLATINAGYVHTSLALRCLRANLGQWRSCAEIVEFDGRAQPEQVGAALAARSPNILAFGVFIWNAAVTARVLWAFREHCPSAQIVLGGPEVSYGVVPSSFAEVANCIILGEADVAFAEVSNAIMAGSTPPSEVCADPPDLSTINGPEEEYADVDLATRIVYLESSRGCPNACAYCLSATAPGVRWRPVGAVETAWRRLLRRGARRLKIVDRTFNVDEQRAARLLRTLAAELPRGGSVQIEMTPDPPGPELTAAMAMFPRGRLRIEVGIQTLEPAVARAVGRRLSLRMEETMAALRHTGAVLHADLIVGLPGETPTTFAAGFDRLVRMEPEELQVNLLKLLRGTPLERHAKNEGMRFESEPPYTVMETPNWPADHLAMMRRFSRFWELLYNRGRFRRTLPLLWEGGGSPFQAFAELSERLYTKFGRLHGISVDELALALTDHLQESGRCGRSMVMRRLEDDYVARGARLPSKWLTRTAT